MPANNPDSASDRQHVNRRRVLQLAGLGIGSFTLTGTQAGIARADSACEEGPFERTYAAETVNISKIATERGPRDSADSMDAHPPTGQAEAAMREADAGHNAQPPATQAQIAPDGGGVLTVGAEYDGIRETIVHSIFGAPQVLPPDSQIAVGRSKALQAINSSIAIFDQRSGRRELQVPMENFFAPIISEEFFLEGIPKVADPRTRYDPKMDRFVICTFWWHFPTWTGAWFLAVSDGSNPNGNWHLYRIPTAPARPGLVDYPTLGLDRDAIYLAAEIIPPAGEFPDDFDIDLVILDKDAAYNGDEVSANHFTGLMDTKGIQVTVQPALQPYSGGESGSFYLMSSQFPDDQLTLWEVTNPLTDPSLACSEIDVAPNAYAPGARQPDTDARLDTVGGRLMNLDYNDGSLWTAHSIRYNWGGDSDEPVSAIRWYEINPTTPEVVQSGTYGEPGTSYFVPHIQSDGDRTLMVYNVSGPETYPGIEVAGRTAEHTPGEMEDSTTIQEGQSAYNLPTSYLTRDPAWWGDYSGVAVHPTTGNFWVTAEYSPAVDVDPDGLAPDLYRTRIAEVSFDDLQDTRPDYGSEPE